MNGRYLLDTNVVIDLLRGNTSVVETVGQSEQIFVPSVVLGELYYGAYSSSQHSRNLELLEEFSASNDVVSCDATTSRYYGEVKFGLRRKGRPIPENDVWIAALSMQHSMTLVTRDTHFDEVDNLTKVAW